jgi:hypothetical protein
MAPWGWVKVENNIFLFPNILREKYFRLSAFLNSNKKNLKCKYSFKLACYCTKTIFKLQL